MFVISAGLACIHLKNFHSASLSWVIAVQSEVVGRVGQTAAATCGTHTVYRARRPRWSGCFQIGLTLGFTTTLSLSVKVIQIGQNGEVNPAE